jgi:cation diffusion facilitator family transporter
MANANANARETERRQARRLLIVLVVIAMFFVVELIGAKAANSDVLEADAYHLLMDVFALGISLGAMRIASRHPSDRYTFGLRRAEPMAALVNGALVLAVCAELVRDAVDHLRHPEMPKAGLMLMVSIGALFVNGISAWVLHGAMHAHGGHAHGHGHGHDHGHHDHHRHDDEGEGHAHSQGAHLNLRGAWLHLIGDALGSVAALVASLVIRFGGTPIVDPIASLIVVAILFVGALRLLRDAGAVLLDAAPKHLPVDKVKKLLLAMEGVKEIHALHVWSLGTGHDAVTAHLVVDDAHLDVGPKAADKIRHSLKVEYVTVQVEHAGGRGVGRGHAHGHVHADAHGHADAHDHAGGHSHDH